MLAFGSVGTLVVTFYRLVMVPRREQETKNRKEVFAPIVDQIESTARWVGDFTAKGVCDTLSLQVQPWVSKIDQVPRELREPLKDITAGLKEYCDWMSASSRTVESITYNYLLDHPEFPQEYDTRGMGKLRDKLVTVCFVPILQDRKITRSLLQDSDPRFWDTVQACQSKGRLDGILQLLDDLRSHSSIENARKARDNFLRVENELAAKVRKEWLREPALG